MVLSFRKKPSKRSPPTGRTKSQCATRLVESAVVTKDKDGKPNGFAYVKRPALLSDPILGPYLNDADARANQNGALPPDLSVIAKARNTEYHGGVFGHPASMLGDIVSGYQEGGPNYFARAADGLRRGP